MGWLTRDPGEGQTHGRIVKKADETENNSTTLQDDDELVLPVRASRTYGWLLLVIYEAGATPDLKLGFSVPAGATMVWNPQTQVNNALDEGDTYSLGGGGVGVPRISGVHGRLIVAGTAGNFQVQWAQNALEVSDTKMLQGATLVMWEDHP